ncbi:MAG: hypothetical protein CL551_02240 [Alcanivorax sp.]|nr:hypothetical protein [Alcanivorax sp.]|tara:strand:+ start:67077 stop:70727 length:3651 start_codon:yes stop_codon:yes gene_type:complete
MNKRILKQSCALLLSATVLAACGGGGDDPAGRDATPSNRELTFAYPDNGQTEIAGPAPVVLRFSGNVTLDAVNQGVTLVRARDGAPVDFTPEIVGKDPGTVLIQPDNDLDPHTRYEVRIQGLALENGTADDQTVTFTTRALQRGPRELVTTSPDFELNRAFPSGGEQEPVMDFSTFRFQFSQPIDPATVSYGHDGSVRLVDAEGDLVAARLLVDGPYMTLDPRDEYLTPGARYTLYLEPELASRYGESFAGEDFRFQPKDSSPNGEPVFMVQRITEPDDPGAGDGESSLTGQPINQVPVNSTLLGQDSATQSSGNVSAELASTVSYPDVTPFRIARGTLLTGSNIDVMIGGAVPAGISSGQVNMHFLSDATGYMVPNPYSTADDAPRVVKLFMDVAINTENPEANGGFTQDLLHIELIGLANINPDQGALNLDAVSMVEPDVLGQEFANGLLSFQLRSYKDQTNPPAPTVDNAVPTLQSWTFGEDGATGLDKTAMVKPTDPIILNFSEPLDRDTVTGKVHLYKNEGGTQTEMDTTVTVDGGAIVIRPAQALEHPTETGPSLEYQVSIDPGITDLSGEPWVESFDETFALRTQAVERDTYRKGVIATLPWLLAEEDQPLPKKSPFLLAVYPGFPCALNTNDQDLAAGVQGRCNGGIQPESIDPANLSDLTPDEMAQIPPVDDLLPVADMPANRPIVVVFSKDMDPASIELGRTFNVYEIDDQDQIVSEVDGSLSLNGDTLRFMPSDPWKENTLYRYELASNGDIDTPTEAQAANPTGTLCDVDAMICSDEGLPLQTQLMSEVTIHDVPNAVNEEVGARYRPYFIWEEKSPSLTGGGPDLVQYFQGTENSEAVLQLLRLADSVDANANLVNDSTPQVMGPPPIYYAPPNDSPRVTGSISYNFLRLPEYNINETDHVTWQPDPSTADLVDRNGVPMDPNGVKAPPNSAKILSQDMGDRSLEEVEEKGFSITGPTGEGTNINDPAAFSGLLVGCGYERYEPYPDQTGCDVAGEEESYIDFTQTPPLVTTKTCYQGVPAECAQDKFTYLNGALFAEVTDQPVGDGLKVLIHPGHMVTTSFRAFLKGALKSARGEGASDSGYQLMRMRYVDGGPIEARIMEGAEGPELSASVPLYLDAPYLATDLVERKRAVNTAHHNLYSYDIAMDLSGPLSFLDDGRMVAEQWNDTPVDIEQRMNVPRVSADLLVPVGGTHIRYVSEPIK